MARNKRWYLQWEAWIFIGAGLCVAVLACVNSAGGFEKVLGSTIGSTVAVIFVTLILALLGVLRSIATKDRDDEERDAMNSLQAKTNKQREEDEATRALGRHHARFAEALNKFPTLVGLAIGAIDSKTPPGFMALIDEVIQTMERIPIAQIAPVNPGLAEALDAAINEFTRAKAAYSQGDSHSRQAAAQMLQSAFKRLIMHRITFQDADPSTKPTNGYVTN